MIAGKESSSWISVHFRNCGRDAISGKSISGKSGFSEKRLEGDCGTFQIRVLGGSLRAPETLDLRGIDRPPGFHYARTSGQGRSTLLKLLQFDPTTAILIAIIRPKKRTSSYYLID